MQGLPDGSSWLAGDGTFGNPAPAEEDDWLAGMLQGDDEALPLPGSPSISGELGTLFNPPPSMQHRSMYKAFSTGDLQSLGGPSASATNAWNSRVVSVKPTLQSVPELGPAEPDSLAAYARGHLFGDGLEYLDAVALTPDDLLPRPMAPMAAASPGSSGGMDMHGAGPGSSHAAMFAGGTHSMVAFGAPNGLVMGIPAGYSMGQAGVLHAESPEHAMTDVKQEPVTTASQGVGMAPQHMPQQHLVMMQQHPPHQLQQPQQQVQMQHAGYLAPSGGGMRKSHSALELGAWKKMAEGNLDGVDPSGNVREVLQGLDMTYAVGKLTPQERLQKILRYRAKRQLRNFKPAVKYQCRKSLADTRPRVRGRFARDNEPGSVMPHETKKAMREKGGDASAAAAAAGTGSAGSAGEGVAAAKEAAVPPPAPALAGSVAVKAEQKTAVATGPVVPAPSSGAAARQAGQPQQVQQQQQQQQQVTQPNLQALQEQQSAPEHPASALAHLYCQWSEVVVPPA